MKAQPVLVAAAVAIVLAAGYLFIKPKATDDDLPARDRPAQASAPPASAASSPAGSTPAASTPAAAQTHSPSATLPRTDGPPTVRAREPAATDIVVHRGQRVAGPAIVKAVQDEEVVLRITSDEPDEVHVQRYNVHAVLRPDVAATLRFKAKLTGRFPYELHKSGLELGAVEVAPR